MTNLKRLSFLFFSLLLLSACSVAPKGEYSRTEIDRPYSLNEDVAKVSFGMQAWNISLDDASDSATGEKESDGRAAAFLSFENGITDNFTALYFPFGFRYQIWRNEKHTFGISAATLIMVGALSVDYWYRINSTLSIRPYFRSTYFNFIFVEEYRQFAGAQLLFQADKYLSFGFFGHTGNYKAKSELIDAIVRGISNSDDFTTESSGKFWSAGVSSNYSLGDSWDIAAQVGISKFDLNYTLTSVEGQLGFNYYW